MVDPGGVAVDASVPLVAARQPSRLPPRCRSWPRRPRSVHRLLPLAPWQPRLSAVRSGPSPSPSATSTWADAGLALVSWELVKVYLCSEDTRSQWAEERKKILKERLGVEAGMEDARVLTVRFDGEGARHRDFAESIELLDPQEFEDWPLEPPRSVKYWCKEVRRQGVGVLGRHEKWKRDRRLTDDDAGVCEHDVASEIIQLALEYDRVDINNLCSFERLLRCVQFIEEGYRQKQEEKRLQKSKDSTASMADHFAGKPRMAGCAIVMPALLKHVADKAAQDNEIRKQQREAAEARGLLKQK